MSEMITKNHALIAEFGDKLNQSFGNTTMA